MNSRRSPAPIAPRTVIEGLLPLEGALPLSELYALANRLGIGDQPLRLAIRRLSGAGEVEQRGRGRGGALALTAQGRDRLMSDRLALRLALAQDRGEAPWTGVWHLIAVNAPESARAVRDGIRASLIRNGAAAVSTSLYASPHDLAALLPPESAPHVVVAVATALDVRGETDPIRIAETLWPAAPTVRAYGAVSDALAADDPADAAPARRLRLADALERAMRHDPLLPGELRASPWPPAQVRLSWRARWESIGSGDGPAVYPGWLPES